jgi:DnaK suppressor protein
MNNQTINFSSLTNTLKQWYDSQMKHDQFTREMQVALTNLTIHLTESLAAINDEASTVTLDQSSVGRLSRMDAMTQQQMALAGKRRMELKQKQVDRAMKAIADGVYGECVDCGEDIRPARLRARPEAPFCIECASAR